MPILKLCTYPGCTSRQASSRCTQHANREEKGRRPNAAERGYCSKQWRNLRKLVIHRDAHCQWPGCMQPISDVDHIKPKADGGDDSMDNLQGLCRPHHSVKTRNDTMAKGGGMANFGVSG
jgi:5-methylcytosine-specific restriction protein A